MADLSSVFAKENLKWDHRELDTTKQQPFARPLGILLPLRVAWVLSPLPFTTFPSPGPQDLASAFIAHVPALGPSP